MNMAEMRPSLQNDGCYMESSIQPVQSLVPTETLLICSLECLLGLQKINKYINLFGIYSDMFSCAVLSYCSIYHRKEISPYHAPQVCRMLRYDKTQTVSNFVSKGKFFCHLAPLNRSNLCSNGILAQV